RLGPTVWDARGTYRDGRYAGPGDSLPRRACRVVWLCRRRPPSDGRARRRTHPDPVGATDSVSHWRTAAGVESPGGHVRRFGATYGADRLSPRHAEWLRLASVSRPAVTGHRLILWSSGNPGSWLCDLPAWHGQCHDAGRRSRMSGQGRWPG